MDMILFVFYVVLIVCDFTIDFLGIKSDVLFSIVLAVVSLNLLYKGVLLRSSSTLWFSLNLIIYAILIVIFKDLLHSYFISLRNVVTSNLTFL